MAKDGADLPESRQHDAAEEVVIGQGETLDFALPATLQAGAALVVRYPGSPNRPWSRLPIRVP